MQNFPMRDLANALCSNKEENLKRAERAIGVAKAINVPVLNMHMNHGVYFTLPDRKVQLFEQYSAEYMASWKRFRDVCENAIGGISGIRML